MQTLIHTYKVVCGKLKRNDPPQFWKDKIADKKSYCCNVIDRRRGILIVPYCVPRYYVVCWLLRRAKKIRFHPNMDAAMAGRAHGGPRGLAGLPFSGAPVNDMVGFWQGENSLFLLPSGFFFFFFLPILKFNEIAVLGKMIDWLIPQLQWNVRWLFYSITNT